MEVLKGYVTQLLKESLMQEKSSDGIEDISVEQLPPEFGMMVNMSCTYNGSLIFTPNESTVSEIEKLHKFSKESQDCGMHILLMNILTYHKLANGINDYTTKGVSYEYIVDKNKNMGISLTNGDNETVILEATIAKILLAEQKLDSNLVRVLSETLSKLIIYKSLFI